MARLNIDPDHAVGEFTNRHMMVTPMHGQFNKVSGLINFDPADQANASVEIEIDVAGLNHCKVTGDLTIHGITKSVMFDVTFAGPSRFFDDELNETHTTFGFRASASINREDFGVKWNTPIEDGVFMVGKHADIVLNAEEDLIK